MDMFRRFGQIFKDDHFTNVQIPYAGELPPPGYTLYQEALTYVQLCPDPYANQPIYNYYPR